jgi:hypothetical protein
LGALPRNDSTDSLSRSLSAKKARNFSANSGFALNNAARSGRVPDRSASQYSATIRSNF